MLGLTTLGRRPLAAPLQTVREADLNRTLAGITKTITGYPIIGASVSKALDNVLPPAAVVFPRAPLGLRPLGSPAFSFAPAVLTTTQTLTNTVVTSAGTNTDFANLNKTLANETLSSTVSDPVAGTVNKTLAILTSVSAGALALRASVWKTLTEPSSENLMTYSEDFSQWTLVNSSTRVLSASPAPDGTMTAWDLTDPPAAATSTVRRVLSGLSIGVTYCISSYVLKDSVPASTRTVRVPGGAVIDTSTGSIYIDPAWGTTGVIDSGSYWRTYVTFVATATSTNVDINPAFNLGPVTDTNNTTAQGTVTIWGVMTNLGSTPKPYVPTQSSAITGISAHGFSILANGGLSIASALTKTLGALTTLIDGTAFGRTASLFQGIGQSAATNLITQSETLSTWTTIGSASVTPNAGLAPNGLMTATLWTEDTATSTHRVYNQSTTLTAGMTATGSVYLKTGTAQYAVVHLNYGSANVYVGVDLLNGTLGTITATTGGTAIKATLELSNNGFYRVSVTGILQASATAYYLVVSPSPDGVVSGQISSFLGTGRSFYIWGAQLEAGSVATAYIPTTTAAVARTSTALTTGITGALVLAANLWKTLTEPAAQNLMLWSQDFSQWGGSAAVAINTTAAPDGTITADSITDANAGTSANSNRGIGGLSTGVTYCLSAYFLKDSVVSSTRTVGLYTNASGGIVVDTQSGAFFNASGVTAGVIDEGLYWRAYVVFVAAGTTDVIYVYPAFNTGLTGSTNVAAVGSTVCWGAQLEVGSYPTPYMVTSNTSNARFVHGLSAVLAGAMSIGSSLSKTLSVTQLVSTVGVSVAAALSRTLTDITRTIAGSVSIVGSLTGTLSTVTKNILGGVSVTSALTKTLDVASAVATGGLTVAATLSKTLGAVTLVAGVKVYIRRFAQFIRSLRPS